MFLGCDDVRIYSTTNYKLGGKYYIHFGGRVERCNDNWMYRHQTEPYYLYYVDGWWIVSEGKCDPDGLETALLRTRELPAFRRPTTEIWHERNGSGWEDQRRITAACQGMSDLSVGQRNATAQMYNLYCLTEQAASFPNMSTLLRTFIENTARKGQNL